MPYQSSCTKWHDLFVIGDQEDALAWARAHRSKRTTRVLGGRFRSSIAELVDAL
jgi:hypothetical protein